VRALVIKKYFNGHKPTDREIAAVCDHCGKWKYLAYWFDSACWGVQETLRLQSVFDDALP
jgi:hypothetical protein